MIKILFTTPILEHPPAGGPELRIHNSIKALAKVSELYIFSRCNRRDIGGFDAENYFINLCHSFNYSPSCKRVPKNRYFRKIGILFNTLTWYHTFRDTLSILKIIDRKGIDIIWFGYGNISYQLIYSIRIARPNIKIVCDTDSIWSRFILRELPYTKNIIRRGLLRLKANRKVWEEKAMIQLCNITTAVSEIDAGYYQSISHKINQVYLFPNVIDLKDYSLNLAPPSNLKTPCMFLSGSFGNKYSSMNIAANWVLDKILPLVQSQIPDIHFYIVGKNADIALSDAASESVTIIGKIPSVLPFLCHANVSLVPLMFESGTRFKILEAAVCKVPIVSTTLGAEGLPVVNGQHLLIADGDENFASAIVEIIHDQIKAAYLVENCYKLVEKKFSVESLVVEANKIINKLVQT